MKLLLATVTVLASIIPAFSQTAPAKDANNENLLSAIQTESEGEITHLRGHVEIVTGSVVIRADEADFNFSTGEVQPRGNVSIRLTANPQTTPKKTAAQK